MLKLNDRFFNAHDTTDIMTVVALNREEDGITIMYEDGRIRNFWHLNIMEQLIERGKYIMVPEIAPEGWKWCPQCNDCAQDFMTTCIECGHKFESTRWMHIRTALHTLKVKWQLNRQPVTQRVFAHKWE